MDSLSGKTALITGGAGALGSAIAKKLSSLGCQIAIADINGERVEKVASGLKNAISIPFDATSVPDCQKTVQEVLSAYGRIDYLIHGVSHRIWKTIKDMEPEEWKREFDINYYSLVNITRELYPVFKSQRYGRIIHLNAMAGKFGKAGESACSTAMHACRGFLRVVAAELGTFNVMANALCISNMPQHESYKKAMAMKPGFDENEGKVLTTSRYLQKQCSIENVTAYVEFLLGDHADFVTGQGLNITGGLILY
ncbi:MAG: SDR family NAD(P)-dependent oxidoreductase [Christensenellales bacterium]